MREVKHKLVARYSESLGRKQWVIMCGAPLEGAKVKDNWADVKCPACRVHKRVVKKRAT